jgi:hypothetical protein
MMPGCSEPYLVEKLVVITDQSGTIMVAASAKSTT